MNLKYMKVSLFEISKKKKNFFTIFKRCLDVPVYVIVNVNRFGANILPVIAAAIFLCKKQTCF